MADGLRVVAIMHSGLHSDLPHMEGNPDLHEVENCAHVHPSKCGLSEMPVDAVVFQTNSFHDRLESLNVGWAKMSLGAVVYLVTSLPPSVHKLNLSGCEGRLQDEGEIDHL